MASCELYFHTKNPQGEVVESKLFKDLLHYTSNDRAMAKEYYGIGINKEFLSKISDQAEFDENGEITFKSLRKLANINLSRDKEIVVLNKDLKAGTYDYDIAMSHLQNFNRNNPYNDKYMATINSNENGKYTISVVERNSSTQKILNEFVENQNLTERLKYFLREAGVDYTFLEEGERIGGRYSTKNAKKTADGLYQLIKVANNKDFDKNLSEEIGHFIIGAMNNSPLVSRLIDLLSPEVQEQFLGEEDKFKYMGENSKRELAGALIGKALLGEIDKQAPWQTLLNRLIDYAKTIFAKLKGDRVLQAKIESNQIADRIARGFMSPNFTGSVEEAVNVKETLYSAKDSFNVQQYKRILGQMKLLANKIKDINKDVYREINNQVLQIEAGMIGYNPGDALIDVNALDAIGEAVIILTDLMQNTIPILLQEVNFSDESDFKNNMGRNAKNLLTVREFVRDASIISETIKRASSTLSGSRSFLNLDHIINVRDVYGNEIKATITELSNQIDAMLTNQNRGNSLMTSLMNKEFEFFLRFLENSHGSKYITRAAGVIFNSAERIKQGGNLLVFKEDEEITISQILEHLDKDITFFEAYVASMSNNSDIIGQIIDKVAKEANMLADKQTNLIQDKLRMMEEEWKKLGYTNTEILMERYENQVPTGNFISKHHWGNYEKDWNEFKKKHILLFKEQNPNYKNLSEELQGVLFRAYFNPLAKEWHKGSKTEVAHSQWDHTLERYVPNDTYLNEEYNKTIAGTKAEAWLNEMLDLKRHLDSKLGDGATNLYRLPQFKGTFTNKMKNRKYLENTAQAFKNTLKEKIIYTFAEDSEDVDYGSDMTYNEFGNDIMEDRLAFEKEKLNRIPIFGVNKLKNPADISTDIFHSMLAYAGMANTYESMSQIVDTVRVGGEVLSRRSVGGIESEGNVKGDVSRAYTRYLKYVEKQIYGVNTKKIALARTKNHTILANKITRFITGLGSKLFLGGNVAGGIVNIGTGTLELFKESLAGEHIDIKDFTLANKLYFKDVGENMYDGLTGELFSDNKVALFQRYFNIRGDSREKQRNWHTDQWRITRANPFGQNLFLPYAAGEHYMQTIPYLALANKIKIYDNQGNKISLLNAYKIADLGNGVRTLMLAHNPQIAVELSNIGMKLNDAIAKNLSIKNVNFTAEELKYIRSKGFSEVNIFDLMNNIENEFRQETTFFKTKDSQEKYNSLLKAINEINDAIVTKRQPNLSQEIKDHIISQKYDMENLENLKSHLEQDLLLNIWHEDDESSYMDKSREIANRMHGIYNKQDKTTLQQTIIGEMFLAMKGYALGLSERRFSQSKYSVALGGESEGSIRTLAKVLASTFTNKGGFGLTLSSLLIPFSSKTEQRMLNAGFSKNQYYNMRRNFMDYSMIIALKLLKWLTGPKSSDDDDEEEDQALGIAHYFINRLLREQSAYALPVSFRDEMKNVANISPVGVSAVYQIFDFTRLFAGDISGLADIENSQYYYQTTNPTGIYKQGDPKWVNKGLKMFPWYRSKYVFEYPYKAVEGFEYSRIKNR